MRFPALGAGYMYLLLASNFDWLIALFTCVVIGQSNNVVWVLQIVFLRCNNGSCVMEWVFHNIAT